MREAKPLNLLNIAAWLISTCSHPRPFCLHLGDRALAPCILAPCNENQQAFKDPLHVPVGPITKARSMKIKEALNGPIQEIWADSNARHSKLGPKEDEGVINLIQTIEG